MVSVRIWRYTTVDDINPALPHSKEFTIIGIVLGHKVMQD